jgi:hypothetical protein
MDDITREKDLTQMIQTWLPVPSFHDSAELLSDAHLDLQRYHVLELLEYYHEPEESQLPIAYDGNQLDDHPIVDMWRGYELQLCEYGFEVCEEWAKRFPLGKEIFYQKISYHLEWANTEDALMHKPNWFGEIEFHESHQYALLKLDPEYYGTYFFNESDGPVIWPRSDYRAT